ncbi:hypothetical protein H4R21_006143 [Coemansia helicoidea]|uniref:Uncharacterized protein n=1 Tax=Coemansia helicoidea TaxID=1286919 RepID=A0ACC1KNI5_9FUNG|nr:hypothetical protein H4R21_006143 [Coemansia helicoidea]
MVKKFVPRGRNVAQIAVLPVFWGLAVEAAQSLGWTAHRDIAPWDPVPGRALDTEALTVATAWKVGLNLWGKAAKTEGLWAHEFADWVAGKAPPDPDPPAMARADGLPTVDPYDLEEGEIRELPEWAGEPQAPTVEKRKETPEEALSKRTRGEGGARQTEFDGTLGTHMVPDWKPAEDFSGDEAESEARAKRPVKKPAGMQSSARPAAAGPPSTSPAMGSGPGGPSSSQ